MPQSQTSSHRSRHHSQPSRHPSHSPPTSDTENHPTFDAETPHEELLKIARQYQINSNTAQAQANRLSRKLADITNGDDNNNSVNRRQNTNKRRRITEHPSSEDEGHGDNSEDVDADAIQRANEAFLNQAGHKFFLIYGPWLRSGDDIFDQKLDDRYKAEERFESEKNKVQGQLREIVALLQERFQWVTLRQRWARREFSDALKSQRYNTANRLRQHCASILGVPDNDVLLSEVRRTKFREEIGWVSTTGTYSAVDVPLLHEVWHGHYSLSSVFLNPKLMGIYVALIRGPSTAKHFMNGHTFHSQSVSMARIHSIRHTTPGAIATSAVLARWTLSGDEALQEVGSNTGINYLRDYEEYLMLLETGLQQRKKSILNVFKQWDAKVFPDSDSSVVGGRKTWKNGEGDGSDVKRAMDLLAADSEESQSEAESEAESESGNGN